jgi:hypothetical protein
MFTLGQPGFQASRREWLRLGGLGALGLSLPDLLADRPVAAGKKFGKAKSCILFFLGGGPSQHETFDPKPNAPREIRGDFKPLRTKVPGMHFCELLPRVAKVADKLTIIRSMHSDINVHSLSGYYMLTGRKHPGRGELSASPKDWPSIASVVGQLKPSRRVPFSSVALPEVIHNDNAPPWPGQNGGFMGITWHPHVLHCNPSLPGYQVRGLELPEGLGHLRVKERASLRQQLDEHFLKSQGDGQLKGFDVLQQRALDVLRDGAIHATFQLDREKETVRDRYGRTHLGQSVLLARRMIQAGVRLVQVNWPREKGDQMTGNPLWDTHHHNTERLRETLCPPLDQTLSALITDLDERGLLEETLVVVMGEFGRTPKINNRGGRDHWGSCYSVALAGGGVPGGQVIGASDKHGGYPSSRPITPPDLAATIFHLLGIPHNTEFKDRLGRPFPIIEGGQPIREVLES